MTPQRDKTKFDLILSLIPLFCDDADKEEAAQLYDWYSKPEVFQISRPFNSEGLEPAKCARDLIGYYFHNDDRPDVLNSLKELWRASAPWNKKED